MKNYYQILRRIVNALGSYYLNCNNTRNYNIWIFGEWFGKQCSDNVLAFANYVADYGSDQFDLYWLCEPGVDTSRLNNKIKIIDMYSREAVQLQKTAGVAVMNQGYVDFSKLGSNYLGNALTLNLWHGVMWKKIGYDTYHDGLLKNIYVRLIKNTKQYLLFCAPSDKYKELFSNAFQLKKSIPIDVGLPRNEMLFYPEKVASARDKTLLLLKELNLNVNSNTRIITYLPTFRDLNIKPFSFSSFDSEVLNDYLEKNNCIIVQKAHEKDISRGLGFGVNHSNRIVNVDNISPQLLLAATDILITDYSSCMFDFLLLDRPIIQFIYDYDYYTSNDRGVYYSKELLDCGYQIFNSDDLIEAIEDCVLFPDKYSLKRFKIKNYFMKNECANNNEIIYREIIKLIDKQKNIQEISSEEND